jgi:20S proteasome subunit beta 7
MQYVDRHLTELAIDEAYNDAEEGGEAGDAKQASTLNAASLHKYLSKLLYSRRNKFDPLWNEVLVAGFGADGTPFLASADLRGTAYTSPSLATGYGAMLAQPIMRKHAETEADAARLSEEEAVKIVRECMKVLFYRDARSLDSYSIAVVTKEGIRLSEDEKLENQSWEFAERIRGYGTQTV